MSDLLRHARLTPTSFARRHDLPEGSVSRYLNGERGWPWSYIDFALADVETAAGAPLTQQMREVTTSLFDAATAEGPGQRKILGLLRAVQETTAKLSQTHYELQGLRTESERLRLLRQPPPAALHQRIAAAQQSAGQLAAERHRLQREAAGIEQNLPGDLKILTDPDLKLHGREFLPPWWQQPSAPPAAVPPMPVVAPRPAVPVHPPTNHGSRRGLAIGIAMGLMLGLLCGAGVWIAVLLQKDDAAISGAQSPSGPSPALSNGPSTPSPSSPTGNGTASPPASGSSTWKVSYSDTEITMPQTNGMCTSSVMDFEPPRGGAVNLDDFQALMAAHDLVIQNECPTNNSVTALLAQVDRWGTASEQKPSPEGCLDQANRQALGAGVPLSQVRVGSAYCLVTGAGSLVWFKVTAKPGADHGGLTVVATLWTE
ncbi:hypothetical protein [Kitasatospora sp. NPDC007106]|uniref:hypothetical protein n=1 Tax=Kitasatospora sp. NPDC007106 TaxID=3156914 RepID=UPI0033E5E9C3